ncbi:MAG: HAD family hydrolase [Actinomycetota bacterium]
MGRYEAVLFDAGETLVSPQPSFGGFIHRALARMGFEREITQVDSHARAALAKQIETGRPWSISSEASERAWTAIYSSTLSGLEIEDASGAIAKELYAELRNPESYGLFPDALACLRELKVHGYRLGIVSNWESWLSDLLVKLNVMPLLDVCVVSGACGIEKPDARIFQIALEHLDVEPARACYVGDSLSHDVAPALDLGMGAVLIDRHDRHPGAHRPTISSLGLITAVL